VLAAITNPRMATRRPIVICHVRSCIRPELQPVKIPAAPANKKGGQVRTRVIVRLNPRVLTTLYQLLAPAITKSQEDFLNTYVGKKELNEHALRWKFCMKQNNHVLGSLHACLRPSMELTGSVESPTRSRSIRECASSRSSWLSHDVVSGVLGRRKKPNMATTAVTAPSLREKLGIARTFTTYDHLHNEQPSPTCDSFQPIHACEHTCCDQA
jgi:hypothetical protein